MIVKNLFILEENCQSRIIQLFVGDREWHGALTTTLKELGMTDRSTNTVGIRFQRALAYLSEEEQEHMTGRVDNRTNHQYPIELIRQALNMAPECKLEQTMSNLLNHAARVFESIL